MHSYEVQSGAGPKLAHEALFAAEITCLIDRYHMEPSLAKRIGIQRRKYKDVPTATIEVYSLCKADRNTIRSIAKVWRYQYPDGAVYRAKVRTVPYYRLSHKQYEIPRKGRAPRKEPVIVISFVRTDPTQ